MSSINDAKRLVLEQYRKERAELDMMISKLCRDLGENGDIPPVREQTPGDDGGGSESTLNIQNTIKPGDFFGMSQVAAAMKTLQMSGKQPMDLSEIAAALYRGRATETLIQGLQLRNLSSLLSRSDDFISVAKGRWGLAEWYPNRKKNRRNKEDPDQEQSATSTTPGPEDGSK